MRLIADYDGRLPSFVHICAMPGESRPDEWLRPGAAADRYSIGRNTPRNWVNRDWIQVRDGKVSCRDIERVIRNQSKGRTLAKVPKYVGDLELYENEKQLADPFLKPQGLGKLERLLSNVVKGSNTWRHCMDRPSR